MNDRVTKNYSKDGGDTWVVGGKLVLEDGGELDGFPKAVNVASNGTLAQVITALKNAGLMVPDDWNVSVLACPTTSAMPTAETIANSGHATLSIADNVITITLDGKVSDLANANHGETWGTHKWLGFGVRTGLASVAGIKFTDDTGAEVTLASADADEATTLGLSAGDFVLYIKAEQEAYLTGEKYFTLWADGYALTKFAMKIVETTGD